MTVEPLSQRECEAITALGRGASKSAIAHEMSVSPRTVREYIERAYLKLGVHDKAQAVLAHQGVHGICSRG